jgi:HlyD family secretion protein
MKPMTKGVRVAGAAMAVVLIGGLLYWWLRPAHAASTLTLFGNVDIWEVAPAFNDNGRITRMQVVEGDRVRKGELIAELDGVRYRARLANARHSAANLKAVLLRLLHGSRPQEIAQAKATMEGLRAIYYNAEKNYARTLALLPQGIASVQDRDDAVAQVRSARGNYQAALQVYRLAVIGPRHEDIIAARNAFHAAIAAQALAARELADTRLYAPADGVVEDRILEPGDMAAPNTPVYTIALTSPMWVRAYVPEPDLGKIALGMRAVVTTDSFPGNRYRGWVGYISPTAEFTPKTVETPVLRTQLVYQVRVYVCNRRHELHLGMPATVSIDLTHRVSTAAGGPRPAALSCGADHAAGD